jgi:hypothetical protein
MIKRSVRLLLCVCPIIAASSPAKDPFTGAWKLNPSRSTLTDKFKVESAGGMKYIFDLGGGPETIVVDGTDQPTDFNKDGTLSVGVEGAEWKVIRKANGRTTLSATWSLSKDGNTLTDHFTSFNADGSPYSLNYTYARKAGGPGFAGTWVSTSMQAVNYVVVVQVEAYEENGISIIDAASAFTGTKNFAASLVRRVNAHRLELMRKTGDAEPSVFLELELSSDDRTLTITPHLKAGREQQIFVFERQ